FFGDEATGLGWYSPVYGRLEKTTTVRVTDRRDGTLRMAAVFCLDATNPIVDIAWIGDATLRITRERTIDEVAFGQPDLDRLFRRTKDQGPGRTKHQEPGTKDQRCAASLAS